MAFGYVLGALPDELRSRSLRASAIVLAPPDAICAIEHLAAAGFAPVAPELRYRDEGGDLRSGPIGPSPLFEGLALPLPWVGNVPWAEHVRESARRVATYVREVTGRWQGASEVGHRPIYWGLDALFPAPELGGVYALVRRCFERERRFTVGPDTEATPVVVANLARSRRSYARGQLVYVYDVYWGMNDNAKVLARFRRKRRWIKGVCRIDDLENFRPKMVYRPTLLERLRGESISAGLFWRLLSLPQPPEGVWSNAAEWRHWVASLEG